mgnify:CR=1 FL=1
MHSQNNLYNIKVRLVDHNSELKQDNIEFDNLMRWNHLRRLIVEKAGELLAYEEDLARTCEVTAVSTI